MSPPMDPQSHYARLKKDLLFVEGRLKGLYENCLGEEMTIWLDEKARDREACALECEESMRDLEKGAQMPPGPHWDAKRVPAYLRLDLEPRFLVGSIHYELPEKADREEMLELVQKIHELMQSVPAGEPLGVVAASEALAAMESVEWSAGDVKKLKAALSKKFHLLSTLDTLSKDLKNMDWTMSRMEVKKEELGRKQEDALVSGNILVGMETFEDSLALHEDLLRTCHNRILRLEEGIQQITEDSRNRVNEWKKGASSLEVLKDAKGTKQEQCHQDLAKLERGLEYEAEQAMDAHLKHQRDMQANAKAIEDLGKDASETTQRMYELAAQFKAEEAHLREVAAKRQAAAVARVQLITDEAQRVADFERFTELCKIHQACLESTDTLSKSAVGVIDTLQTYLAGTNTFLDQDFIHTKQMLDQSCKESYQKLITLHADMYKGARGTQRRLEHTLRGLEDEVLRNELRAEQCRETLNPEVKRYILEGKRVAKERDQVAQELHTLRGRLQAMEMNHFAKAKAKLQSWNVQVDHPEEDTELQVLATKERLLDHRERMLGDGSDRVIEERENVAQFALQAEEQKIMHLKRREAMKEAVGNNLQADQRPVEQTADSFWYDSMYGELPSRINNTQATQAQDVTRAHSPCSPSRSSAQPYPSSPTVTAPVGFPAAGVTHLTRHDVRRETRKVAAYTAPGAPLPPLTQESAPATDTTTLHKPSSLPAAAKKYAPTLHADETPHSPASMMTASSPASFVNHSVASGRTTPLEIAKQRRMEPRVIGLV